MSSETKHGGARKGAGRKTMRGELKQTTSMRLTPTVLAYLRSRDGSVAESIEDIVRRSTGFRRWRN